MSKNETKLPEKWLEKWQEPTVVKIRNDRDSQQSYFEKNPAYKRIAGLSGRVSYLDNKGNIYAITTQGTIRKINDSALESIHPEDILLGGFEVGLGKSALHISSKLLGRVAPDLSVFGAKIISSVKGLGEIAFAKLIAGFGVLSTKGKLGANNVELAPKFNFRIGEDLVHFEKHGAQIANKLSLDADYSVEQYVLDANLVIERGTYVPELHAYVKIPTGPGSALAPFVGLDRKTNEITTFHLKPIIFFEKNAPSLGWLAKPSSELTDLIGLNQELGWTSPYRRTP